jgi:hypothetical protein
MAALFLRLLRHDNDKLNTSPNVATAKHTFPNKNKVATIADVPNSRM